jgi:hypothetical protein
MFATSFTVILFSRQHFGTLPDVYNEWEPDAEFVGLTKDFSFDCPGVDSGETAVLMFQSLGVASQATVLQINGVDVYGGIPITNERGVKERYALDWSANVMLVESNHQLKAAGNILHVESTGQEFIIDNVVITYKTHIGPSKPPFKPPFPTAIRKRKSPAKRSTRD